MHKMILYNKLIAFKIQEKVFENFHEQQFKTIAKRNK